MVVGILCAGVVGGIVGGLFQFAGGEPPLIRLKDHYLVFNADHTVEVTGGVHPMNILWSLYISSGPKAEGRFMTGVDDGIPKYGYREFRDNNGKIYRLKELTDYTKYGLAPGQEAVFALASDEKVIVLHQEKFGGPVYWNEPNTDQQHEELLRLVHS
jgi:hypothetical protein